VKGVDAAGREPCNATGYGLSESVVFGDLSEIAATGH
jgi:hypothetical protein